MMISTETQLISSATQIQPGQSREYTLGWNISHADARTLGLKLGRHRQNATFKVTRIGNREIRVDATEPTRECMINSSPAVDLKGLDRDLGRRRW